MLLGDTLTEAAGGMVASLYDADIAPIQELVEDSTAFDYASFLRGACRHGGRHLPTIGGVRWVATSPAPAGAAARPSIAAGARAIRTANAHVHRNTALLGNRAQPAARIEECMETAEEHLWHQWRTAPLLHLPGTRAISRKASNPACVCPGIPRLRSLRPRTTGATLKSDDQHRHLRLRPVSAGR